MCIAMLSSSDRSEVNFIETLQLSNKAKGTRWLWGLIVKTVLTELDICVDQANMAGQPCNASITFKEADRHGQQKPNKTFLKSRT